MSCHGNDEGLAFSNGDFLTWDQLVKVLKRFSDDLEVRPVLCVSCCQGYALREKFKALKRAPFCCLIGSVDEPSWSQTLVGFSTLYYQMGEGVNPLEAVKAVRAASMHDEFKVVADGGFSAEWEELIKEAKAGTLMRKRGKRPK